MFVAREALNKLKEEEKKNKASLDGLKKRLKTTKNAGTKTAIETKITELLTFTQTFKTQIKTAQNTFNGLAKQKLQIDAQAAVRHVEKDKARALEEAKSRVDKMGKNIDNLKKRMNDYAAFIKKMQKAGCKVGADTSPPEFLQKKWREAMGYQD